MELTLTNSSRRNFLERLAIASTILVASPTILLAKNSPKALRFAVLGEDASLAKVIDRSDKISLVDDYAVADVIYMSKTNQPSQPSVLEILAAGKHLIIEDNGNRGSLIEDFSKSGHLLIIVERTTDDLRLFENATYFECINSKTFDFQKVITIIDFLERNTKPIKFKIKTVEKPVEIPFS